MVIISLMHIIVFVVLQCLLNFHEDERIKPRNWIAGGGFLVKMIAETNVRGRDLSRRLPAKSGCTISVRLNSLRARPGRSGQRMLLHSLGLMD
jgi:hypothetical protein